MTIGDRIKKLRTDMKITQDELAGYANTTKQTIHKYEVGIIQNIPASKIKLLADRLQTTPAYLMGWEDEPHQSVYDNIDNISPIQIHKIPLLGEIACGEPIYASEHRESYVEIGTDIHADFCLKAKGDSMINARIMDGDIVFIREQNMVDNGEIAAVIIDNDATLKRVYYYRNQNKLILQAENPAYPPFVYIGEELNNIRILGKAVAFQSDVK